MCVRWFLPYVPFLNSENELCNGIIKECEGAFEVTCFHHYFVSEEDRTPQKKMIYLKLWLMSQNSDMNPGCKVQCPSFTAEHGHR